MNDIRKELLYTGKAKDVYKTDKDDEVVIKFRDDITALDGGRKDTLDKKGEYNAIISAKFFEILEEKGVSTQYINLINPGEMLTKKLDMIPLEVICRNIAAGSLLRKYPFHENQKLDPALIQFDYKNDVFHDPMLNDAIIVALKIASQKDLDKIREITHVIDKTLTKFLRQRGLILVDFKLEFGYDENGNLVVGDEISPDTARLWDSDTLDSFDKDKFRKGEKGVVNAYHRVVNLVLNDEDKERWYKTEY